MKKHWRLLLVFALGAFFLAATSVIVPAAPLSTNPGCIPDPEGTDFLALNPEHE